MDHEQIDARVLILEGAWKPDYRELFTKGKVNGVRLSRSMGWKAEGLGFLAELENLISVEIYHADVKDLSVLSDLKDLRYIGLECAYRKFNFSVFQNLEGFAANWRNGCDSALSTAFLRYINLNGYPATDLLPFQSLSSLSRLSLQSRKLETLNGAEHLPNLKQLDLAYCTSLSDISALKNHPSLSTMSLTACKKVSDYSALGSCKNLTRICAENESASLDSIQFVESLTELEWLLLIGMKVADGNLHPLLSLKKLNNLALPSHKHYSPSRDEIRAQLGL
ncbi:hypothetical protein NF212_09325 [Parasalinivibrio latis]